MIRIDVCKKLKFENSSELKVKYEFHPGKISAIYGKSGAGKTTLLNIIAGLITPEKGFIEINGKTWLDTANKVNISPQHRNIGFVFQDYALFPNMTVEQNLLYAAGKNADLKHLTYLLNITGLEAFKKVKPAELSGGQKQRTALARALVRKPSLLLLDEPLSATDTVTRIALQQELLQLQQECKFTTLLVSHNMEEVQALASEILYMDNGNIVSPSFYVDLSPAFKKNKQIAIAGVVTHAEDEAVHVVFKKDMARLLKGNNDLKAGDEINFYPELPEGN